MGVTFFFGSGADSDACSRLVSGDNFAEQLLTENFNKEIKILFGDEFSNSKFLYPTSTKVFVQTIVCNQDSAVETFGEETVKLFVGYYNHDDGINYDDVKKRCSVWYRALMNKVRDDDNLSSDDIEKIKAFFLKRAVLCDSLDEKFNSLRFTDQVNTNAKRVINAYTAIYLYIFKALYDIPEDYKWNFNSIYETLNKAYDVKVSKESYYNMLRDFDDEYDVVTTNYTEIAECMLEKSIVYLHGKMSWFEDLEKLIVYDCKNKSELELLKSSNIIVPFILIPSGVKPLICKKQIVEFSKFVAALSKNNLLVIVGYRFNSEDNHINSIIGEWLNDEKNRLIYLNYNESVVFNNFKWLDHFSKSSVNYSDNIDLSNSKILSINVNSSNCHNAFKKILDYIGDIK